MYWKQVIEQDKVIELLQRAFESDRVAHAYLFHGPDGVGKRAIALALACALQSEGRSDEYARQICAKIMHFQHPDVVYCMPQPTDSTEAAIEERLTLLADNNYAYVDFARAPNLEGAAASASNKLALYNIERINGTLRRTMVRRPSEGRYRMAIVTDADALQTQAANAFLKLLEEPGPETIFILTTSRVDALLPTIISRCQRIFFPPLSQNAICNALIDRLALDAHEARTLAVLADGSYGRALELVRNSELQKDRAKALQLFRLAWTGNIKQQAEFVNEIAAKSREHLKKQLSLMLGWIRDAVVLRAMEDDGLILNQDQSPELRRFCENLPDADLDAMVRLLQRARELVEFQVQPGLILIALLDGLGKAMRGQCPDELAESLTALHWVSVG